jgi:hypothetical protein
MKYSMRKKTYKSNKKFRKNKKNITRKNFSGAGLIDTYNSVNQASQNLYNMYLGAKEKYNTLMNQYNQIEAQYLQMKQTLEKIKNDPEVQEQLNTLSNLNSQLQQNIQNTTQPPSPPQSQEIMQNAGFFDPSQIKSSLQTGVQSANNYYSTKKQQANTSYATAKNVYNNPQVQQNLSDLTKHSTSTLKHGSMFGLNVATGAPISAAYRGYNTYKSAQKGVASAKNLYNTTNDVYRASSNQQI